MDFPLVLESKMFPVQAFFNAMPERALLSALDGFSKGVGAGFNDAVCEFPQEVESDAEMFSGVKFYIFEEELVISNAEFLRCLEGVCQIHIARHPESQSLVEQLLNRVAQTLTVNSATK